jgi:hypothetical protein
VVGSPSTTRKRQGVLFVTALIPCKKARAAPFRTTARAAFPLQTPGQLPRCLRATTMGTSRRRNPPNRSINSKVSIRSLPYSQLCRASGPAWNTVYPRPAGRASAMWAIRDWPGGGFRVGRLGSAGAPSWAGIDTPGCAIAEPVATKGRFREGGLPVPQPGLAVRAAGQPGQKDADAMPEAGRLPVTHS